VREEEKQREKDRKWRFREGEKGRIFERAEKWDRVWMSEKGRENGKEEKEILREIERKGDLILSVLRFLAFRKKFYIGRNWHLYSHATIKSVKITFLW
jgi:hypothetical protein